MQQPPKNRCDDDMRNSCKGRNKKKAASFFFRYRRRPFPIFDLRSIGKVKEWEISNKRKHKFSTTRFFSLFLEGKLEIPKTRFLCQIISNWKYGESQPNIFDMPFCNTLRAPSPSYHFLSPGPFFPMPNAPSFPRNTKKTRKEEEEMRENEISPTTDG